MNAQVVAIYIAAVHSGPTQSIESAHAVPGCGFEGDRHFNPSGTISKKTGKIDPSRQATLIEVEAIEALAREKSIELSPSESRRNIITRGVALNHLVGCEFNIGEVRLRGIRLCEPCGHLEKLTQKGVLDGLIHRGGLRAQILTEGTINVGDPITTHQPQAALVGA